ncbi:MAG: zinc-ribbon domain-containing protein, partial [Clostridia bacterium]|nr:zinc-ribbon domain-containing protein [Clostridia bacterium]
MVVTKKWRLQMKYCINCRHTLSDDAEFCPKCGLKTEGVALCEH